ncbi:MAG: asparagine synthase (glutamine-hydrolyzing) [Phycisphaerales bacterium JB059]
MCGILAIATRSGAPLSLSDTQAETMRDRLAHRGPDDATLLRMGSTLLAHRRLSVIDPTPAGRQPMRSPDGRFTLIYNGELYNDADLRAGLERRGAIFRTHCDTETVLHALATWGDRAFNRMRGMYALALHDQETQTLTLARDPLGVKPLYLWIGRDRGEPLAIAASEIPAILAHPSVTPEPDLQGVSAYLTTIRTVTRERTLFRGVRALRPGQVITLDLRSPTLAETSSDLWEDLSAPLDAAPPMRDLLDESVTLHLRSDVPTCALLSGGLDSSAITALARPRTPRLHTYCAGAAAESDQIDDLAAARLVADHLGVTHTEAPITPELFTQRWPDMIERQGVPLSTPNEVAINEVARVLRDQGHPVTLSGEGADELLGGYEIPMLQAWEHINGAPHLPSDPAHFHILANAWIPPGAKAGVLNEAAWRAVENDHALMQAYTEEFAWVEGACPRDMPREDDRRSRLQDHLRFHRRMNLTNLLQRLDSATMLESVEGRTPFADAVVAGVCERLPMDRKYTPAEEGGSARTKIALREAFEGELPASVVARPKASFPLPFQHWMRAHASAIDRSALARELFTDAARSVVREQPERAWHMAWPMLNVALWGERWWG